MIGFALPPPSPVSTPTPTVQASVVQVPVTAAATGEAYFLFIQGRRLESQGDMAGAIAVYQKAIALVPQAADVRAELAGLYAREGRAVESIAEAEAALAAEPDNREAHRILGFVRSALADNAGALAEQVSLARQAITHFEKALAGGRRDPGVELSLGRLYVRAAQHDKAVVTLQAFLNDQPGYPEGVLLLVESLDAMREYGQAIAVLEPVLRDEPDLARARMWLADLYGQIGRDDDAIIQWAELARTNPSNAAVRNRYATVLVNAGRLDEGRQVLLALTADEPRDISALYLLSQVENRAGNADAADAAARRISTLDATDPRGPLALAEARSARGDFRGAIATLEPLLAAAREQPANGVYARVALELSEALEKTGDFGRSVRVLEDARSRNDRNVDVLHALALAYVRDDKADAAERVYRALLVLRPTDDVALNGLGYLLVEHGGNVIEAIELVTRALAIEPDNPSYLDSLGWAYVRQGKPEEGRPLLARASVARPADSLVWHHLAESLFQLKQYREAMQAWDRALAGDLAGIDVADVTRKRDKARELAGGRP
ncbi:MAG: tetratricopeptide repeat protein [Acidobacteria bacterium]|nr:tetratricopeptide repeat protein [Acidobacteriota bacterium]